MTSFVSLPPGDSLNSPSLSAPPEEMPPPLELSMRDIASLLQESNLKTLMATPPLDLCYDVLCDSETYQVGEGDEGTRGGEKGMGRGTGGGGKRRGGGTGGGGGNRRKRGDILCHATFSPIFDL